MDKCPRCNRMFQDILDFPLVKILEVSIVKPEQIPEVLKHWHSTVLKANEVPTDVLTYFSMPDHSDIREMVHSDDYVYSRMYDSKELIKSKYSKTLNLSNNAKKLLDDNLALKVYLQSLEEKVGKKIEPKELLPGWKQFGSFKWALEVPDSSKKYSGLYALSLDDTNGTASYRIANAMLHIQGMNLGSAGGPTLAKLCSIAEIKYEGELLP